MKDKLSKKLIRSNVLIVGTCWLWQKGVSNTGYGTLLYETSKRVSSHRAAWMVYKGKIPKNKWVLHKLICKYKHCCNPRHLYLGSRSDNMLDTMKTEAGRLLTIAKVKGVRRWWRTRTPAQRRAIAIFKSRVAKRYHEQNSRSSVRRSNRT